MSDTERTISLPLRVKVDLRRLDFNGPVQAIGEAATAASSELLGWMVRAVERRGTGEDYPRTLMDLEKWFAGEEGCREYLFALRWPEGFVCPRCGERSAWAMSRGLGLSVLDGSAISQVAFSKRVYSANSGVARSTDSEVPGNHHAPSGTTHEENGPCLRIVTRQKRGLNSAHLLTRIRHLYPTLRCNA
jgi:hypothetical protein